MPIYWATQPPPIRRSERAVARRPNLYRRESYVMGGRFACLAAVLAVGSTPLAGCGSEHTPLEVSTVRLAVVPGAHHGGAPFTTDMTQEVWHTPRVYAGDEDGTGSALITVNRGQGEVCWEVIASDIELPASASHIHKAGPGVQGPIAIPLTPPDASGTSSGCRSGVDRSLLDELVENPGSFYVNVHTGTYPAGAVRGQLAR